MTTAMLDSLTHHVDVSDRSRLLHNNTHQTGGQSSHHVDDALVDDDSEAGDTFGGVDNEESYPYYGSTGNWKFTPLNTVWISYLLIGVNVLILCLIFIVPIVCLSGDGRVNHCSVEPFSYIIYSHVVHTFLHLVVDQYLKKKHREKRILGYTHFYLETKNIRRTPFYLVSLANVILLLTSTILHDYCYVHNCDQKATVFTDIDFLRGIVTVECLSIVFMWFFYSRMIRSFNCAKRKPDFMRKDLLREWHVINPVIAHGHHHHHTESRSLPPTSRRSSTASSSVKHATDPAPTAICSSNLRDTVVGMIPPFHEYVIERQSELIRFLIDHVHRQNVKIMRLVQSCRAVHDSSNNQPTGVLRPPKNDEGKERSGEEGVSVSHETV